MPTPDEQGTSDSAVTTRAAHIEPPHPVTPMSDSAKAADEHFPWSYTEFGLLCMCGESMDKNEECYVLRLASANDRLTTEVERYRVALGMIVDPFTEFENCDECDDYGLERIDEPSRHAEMCLNRIAYDALHPEATE